MPDQANSKAETYHRHGDPDPSNWQEAPTVTDRPNDTPLDPTLNNSTLAQRAAARQGKPIPAVQPAPETGNSTLAERAAARKKAKKVDEDDAENKAVTSAATKTARGRKS